MVLGTWKWWQLAHSGVFLVALMRMGAPFGWLSRIPLFEIGHDEHLGPSAPSRVGCSGLTRARGIGLEWAVLPAVTNTWLGAVRSVVSKCVQEADLGRLGLLLLS